MDGIEVQLTKLKTDSKQNRMNKLNFIMSCILIGYYRLQMINNIQQGDQMDQKFMIRDEVKQESKFYKKKQVYVKQQPSRAPYVAYEYNMRKIRELGLENNLQFNLKVFNSCSQINKGCNLNLIKKQMNDKNNEIKTVIVNKFQCRLNQYIQNVQIEEAESLQIIRQVVEAAYCVVKSSYHCFNIRAQNFIGVLTSQKKYRWKLDSVPYWAQKSNEMHKSINSPIIFKNQYQPPEAYRQKKELKTYDLQESLVWNIGCIWMHLLYKKHYLSDYENIKKFCLGNGTNGIHSVEVLGIKTDKITKPELRLLLQNLLQFDGSRRMQMKTLFSNTLLAGNIKIFEDEYFQEITSEIYSSQSNILCFQHNYDETDQLLAVLVKKSNEANLDYKYQQKQIIKQIINGDSLVFQKKVGKTKIISKENQSNSVNINMAGLNSQKIFTYSQIKYYFRPYKFYYDKAIFLANCTEEISRKLQEILEKKKGIVTLLSPIHGKTEDFLFTFYFVMNFMRLIYLQTLLQNIKLYRNVFNIPKCTCNIANSQFNSTSQQWQLFNDTALYHALSIYVSAEYEKSERELIKLLQKNGANQSISENCKMEISRMSALNYKVCTIYKFSPIYQNVLKNVLETIDQYSVCRPDFKRASQCATKQAGTNMKNIGLLLLAIFIENERIFDSQHYEKAFGRYMSYPMPKQPEFIKSGFLNIKFSRSTPKSIFSELKNEQGERGDDIFNFENYEKFLVEGDKNKVSEQVMYLVRKLKI